MCLHHGELYYHHNGMHLTEAGCPRYALSMHDGVRLTEAGCPRYALSMHDGVHLNEAGCRRYALSMHDGVHLTEAGCPRYALSMHDGRGRGEGWRSDTDSGHSNRGRRPPCHKQGNGHVVALLKERTVWTVPFCRVWSGEITLL